MKPVYQDVFFEPHVDYADQRGNCFSAVVASLLELPLRAVPNFVEIEVLGGPHWWWFFHRYIDLMGYRTVHFRARNPPINTYYEMGGLSARATESHPIHHSCVYFNGKLVHDPHPDGTGLLTEEGGWYLEKKQ